MTAEEISERFDISLAAAQLRLEEISRIKRRATGQKRPLPDSVVQYLADAEKRGYRAPRRNNGDFK
jgi:hypothetical protein